MFLVVIAVFIYKSYGSFFLIRIKLFVSLFFQLISSIHREPLITGTGQRSEKTALFIYIINHVPELTPFFMPLYIWSRDS